MDVQLQDVCKHYKINNPVMTTDNTSSTVKNIKEVAELLTVTKKFVCHFKHSPMMYQKDTAKRLHSEDKTIGRFSALVQ